MTFLLKQIFSFINLLNSETGTNQIASGIACGLILGFAPMLSLQAALVFSLLFFFRIQIGAAFLSAFFFKFVAFLFDPISNWLGMAILESEGLRPLFTQLYNMPIVPFSRFYNSLVMGAGALSMAFAIPTFYGSRILIQKYREIIVSRFKESRFWKALAATKFYNLYLTYQKLY